MTMKLLTTVALIDAAITSIANRGKKLDSDIQLCALSIVNHIGKHGDITQANKLYLCMPKGSRRRALAEYLLAFGRLQPNRDTATNKEAPFSYDKSRPFNDAVLEEAATTMWYDYAPEPPVIEMFDLRSALHRILMRAKAVGKVDDPELLGRLSEIDAHVQAGHTVEAVTATNGDAPHSPES